MSFDLDQWIEECIRESAGELFERERAELKGLFRLPSFRKLSGLMFQELNGHTHQLTVIAPDNTLAISGIQGKIAGIRAFFNTMMDETHGYRDPHAEQPADLGSDARVAEL